MRPGNGAHKGGTLREASPLVAEPSRTRLWSSEIRDVDPNARYFTPWKVTPHAELKRMEELPPEMPARDRVFIAPRVITTNDNFMGRTERRHALRKGPTIRRGARIGAGAVLCPAVEIGEEAFVGAGAVVVRDVPPRVVVVGNPARVLREVPAEEISAD